MRQDGGSGNANALERVATIQMGYVDGAPNEAANTAKTGTTTVTCVAWYEGTDPNVYNGTVMKTCTAHMSFYSRLDPVAP
jgi:alanine racemase